MNGDSEADKSGDEDDPMVGSACIAVAWRVSCASCRLAVRHACLQRQNQHSIAHVRTTERQDRQSRQCSLGP